MLRAVEVHDDEAPADSSDGAEDKRQRENRQFREMLEPLGLSVSEVAADGHCLFESLSQQLALTTSAAELSANDLRQTAADFMRAHKDMFLPFLLHDGGSPMTDS